MPSFNTNFEYKRCQLENLRKDIRLLEIEEEDAWNKDKITIRLRVLSKPQNTQLCHGVGADQTAKSMTYISKSGMAKIACDSR